MENTTSLTHSSTKYIFITHYTTTTPLAFSTHSVQSPRGTLLCLVNYNSLSQRELTHPFDLNTRSPLAYHTQASILCLYLKKNFSIPFVFGLFSFFYSFLCVRLFGLLLVRFFIRFFVV